MKKSIVLVDWHPKQDWEFLQGLEETTGEKWEVHSCDSSRNSGGMIQKMIHFAKLFYVPFRVIFHRKQYKRVLAFHKIYGFMLAFYFQLFRIKNAPDLTVMTFIYKPKSGLKGKLIHKFVRYCVRSEYIKKLVVYSKSEVGYYANLFHVAEDKFLATNYCIEDRTTQIPIGEKGDYFLSAGKSNRDYAFLLSVWNKDRKLVIVNDSLKEKTDNPNIEVLLNCYGDDFLRLVANCYAVIISLEDPHISSGQLVIMQAMMYGKPIIITKNETLGDYIVHGYDGIIIDKTSEALEKAIAQFEDEEFYHKMSMAERKTFHEKYSLYEFGVQMGKIFENA